MQDVNQVTELKTCPLLSPSLTGYSVTQSVTASDFLSQDASSREFSFIVTETIPQQITQIKCL